jgi:hypothetical protein
MAYPLILSMNIKYEGSTMKIALTAAVLALAPAFMAQARDLPQPKRPAVPSCIDLPSGSGSNNSASPQAAATGELPCPQFLSTTTIQRKRSPQWT